MVAFSYLKVALMKETKLSVMIVQIARQNCTQLVIFSLLYRSADCTKRGPKELNFFTGILSKSF